MTGPISHEEIGMLNILRSGPTAYSLTVITEDPTESDVLMRAVSSQGDLISKGEINPVEIASIISITRAGATYVQLDVAYPEQKRLYVLFDASPPDDVAIVTSYVFQGTVTLPLPSPQEPQQTLSILKFGIVLGGPTLESLIFLLETAGRDLRKHTERLGWLYPRLQTHPSIVLPGDAPRPSKSNVRLPRRGD